MKLTIYSRQSFSLKNPVINRALGNKACGAIDSITKKQQIFSIIIKRTCNSLDKECAAFGCSSRIYYFVNKERKPIGISFFKFPKLKTKINDWCNLIKRQNGKDGFVIFLYKQDKKKSKKVVTKIQWTCLMLILLLYQPHLHFYLMTWRRRKKD